MYFNDFKISELTKKRWKKFKQIKRAWYSLLLLGFAWILSLFAPFIAGDKPIYLNYQGKSYFPVFRFYSANTFEGKIKTEANYKQLKQKWDREKIKYFAIFPVIPHDPLHSYVEYDSRPPHPPSLQHWLGTDRNARDVLSRIIYGFRICMSFALVLMGISLVIGSIIGGIQGYLAGKVDLIIQRFIEIWATLPFLYVVILIGSIYGRSFAILIFVISLFNWIGISYYMRAEFLRVKNQTFIKAAKTLGYSQTHIFFREMLPNTLTPIITFTPFILISGISYLTALDFLGFGLQAPTPSWGALISDGLQALYAPWITISAVAALFLSLLLTTFIGEGLREAFDPKGQ